jgi:hypothetical protein
VYREQMRRAVPDAQPFGLADGWGLGLALFSSGDTVWVGHDGNADGTACYLRIEPVNGCVVALTTNASNGIGMWLEVVAELARAGLPVGNHSPMEALGRPASTPPDCDGTYLNGDVQYCVTTLENGHIHLEIEGEAVARLTFHEGLTFAQQDLTSGQSMYPGRVVPDPVTGEIAFIQIGGRLARRVVPPAPEGEPS